MKTENQDFDNYIYNFIQRHPRYATKLIGGTWRTKNKPLSDIPIKAHLAGRYAVAGIGKYYPSHAVLDIDSRPMGTVEEIKSILGLNESNCMLCRSESPDCYHLLIRPEYKSKPSTIRLMNDAFSGFVYSHGIEFYPKKRKPFRLPFGKGQNCLDPQFILFDSWQDQLHGFEKLEPFNLSAIPMRQLIFDFESLKTASNNFERFGWFTEGKELLEHGLQSRSSRHHSQLRIIYYLWRINVDQSDAERIVWLWIRSKHNGFSDQIISDPRSVKKDIESQVNWLYSMYEFGNVYPDSTHNGHHGYISKPDLKDIIQLTGGSLPKMKFLFNLIKFANPRRYRNFIDIHSDKLIEWASKDSYLTRINEASEKGIIKRYGSYTVGRCSKSFKIRWPWRGSSEAVLSDGRSIDTLKGTLKTIYKADDLRQLLLTAGSLRSTATMAIKEIFDR